MSARVIEMPGGCRRRAAPQGSHRMTGAQPVLAENYGEPKRSFIGDRFPARIGPSRAFPHVGRRGKMMFS
jgi:hypothetical protein